MSAIDWRPGPRLRAAMDADQALTHMQRDDRLRVRTPYLYPDGDAIDLYFREQDDVISVSDLGETTRWLHMQSTSLRRSPKQKALIEDICQTHGVEFYKGVLVARCPRGADLAATSLRVAQAALRVSDLWFTFRNRLVQSLADDVADLFTDRQIPFERGEKLVGRSGKVWMPDFHVRTLRRSSIVCVLDTGNRSMARSLVSQVYTTYADLNHLAALPIDGASRLAKTRSKVDFPLPLAPAMSSRSPRAT